MEKYCKNCVYAKNYDKMRFHCDKYCVRIFKHYMNGSLPTPADRDCNDWELKITRNVAKLKEILKKEMDVDIIPVIYRVRVGYCQRAEGGWCWKVLAEKGMNIGSQESLKRVVSAERREYLMTDVCTMEVIV